ncbi:hypothetical protein CEXT_287841 [Caerostris extrusa]|uniref:Uncharacterized protein n=1 Tax=Caerostris extrusa TaxID=172846 RepID=A0AAV4RLT8_CAEEX|nr:hypothetical protein CEXT_287841 [Caerostris extrusa]
MEYGDSLQSKLKGKCRRKRTSTPRTDRKILFVRRRRGEEYHPDYIVRTVRHATSIMVWSLIYFRGTCHLQIVQGAMKQNLTYQS